MSDEKKVPIEDFVLSQALSYAAVCRAQIKTPVSPEEAVSFAEKLVIEIRRKKNTHVEKHGDKYDVQCIFCVDAISVNNQGE
jgi:hypothetical protein